MTNKAFKGIVAKTIAELPEEFRTQLDNVEIVIDDTTTDPSILGHYYGIPRTEREHYSSLPDKITIYKNVLEQYADTPEDLKKEIENTVLHEIGHHFGLDDEKLAKLERKQ